MAKKKIIILALVLLLTFVLILLICLKFKPLTEEKQLFSLKAKTYYISGSEQFPTFFKELIADPFKVKLGEKQTFSIWAKDPKGIKKVSGEITTDKGKEQIEFSLVEGAKEEGRWQGSWMTKDITSGRYYNIVLQAINEEGKETKLPFNWPTE